MLETVVGVEIVEQGRVVDGLKQAPKVADSQKWGKFGSNLTPNPSPNRGGGPDFVIPC